jgi:hypothetical protein
MKVVNEHMTGCVKIMQENPLKKEAFFLKKRIHVPSKIKPFQMSQASISHTSRHSLACKLGRRDSARMQQISKRTLI